MPDDLSEIKERLDHCDAEAAVIKREIKTFVVEAVETRTVFFGIMRRASDNNRLIQVRLRKNVPTSIRVRIGTTIHEIRACLDSLTAKLAERNGSDPSKAYFPIPKDRTVMNEDGLRKLKGISDDDRQKILELRINGEDDPFMFGMHASDRMRKHQRLTANIIGGPSIGIGNGYAEDVHINRTGPLSDQWQTAITMSPRSWLDVGFDYSLFFDEPDDLRGIEVIEGIGRFLRKTREIVAKFDSG